MPQKPDTGNDTIRFDDLLRHCAYRRQGAGNGSCNPLGKLYYFLPSHVALIRRSSDWRNGYEADGG